jgi:hypothetical protein
VVALIGAGILLGLYQNCSEGFQNALSFNETSASGGTNDTPPLDSEPAAVATRSAFSTIQAESFDSQFGSQIESGHVGYLDADDYLLYKAVSFEDGAKSISFQLGVPADKAGKKIQVRLDNKGGPMVGELTVESTGSWSTFKSQAINLSSTVTGVRDLYLVMAGGSDVANVDHFVFSKSQVTTSTPAPAPTTPSVPVGAKCQRFQPGNYIMVEDERGQMGYDGVGAIDRTLAMDSRNVKGFMMMENWATIEKSRGVYDFSRIDLALSKVKAKGKFLILNINERSFRKAYANCPSGLLPSYVASFANGADSYHVKCTARIWEQATMDDFIRIHLAVANKYGNEPAFLGFQLGEVAMHGVDTAKLITQWKRLYLAVGAGAPTMMIGNAMGWVPKKDQDGLAQTLASLGSGGMLSWPDTLVPQSFGDSYIVENRDSWLESANGSTWGWYSTAREFNKKLIIAPHTETPLLPATRAAHDYAYEYLRDNIGAHIIMWADYHPHQDPGYLANIVLPTINKYNGVLNSACPFQ